MKKLSSLLFSLLLVLGLLAGCGDSDKTQDQNKDNATTEQQENKNNDEVKADFPVTIKDALGDDVTIESKPERIVSLIPSNTETAFALGLGDSIVGVNDFDNYPAEVADKEKIGSMEFNVEKIISLNPDLVLAHGSGAHNSVEGLQQLRDAGIAVLVIHNAQNFEEVYESIKMIGLATGTTEKAREIVASMQEKVDEIKEKAQAIKDEDRKSVFTEISPAPDIYAAGKHTFIDEMLGLVNADNVVTEEGWPQIDPEAIVASNPDVIITTHGYYTEDPVGSVLEREGWGEMNALKNRAIVDVDSDMVTRAGPRLAEGVEELAKAIYPDVFK